MPLLALVLAVGSIGMSADLSGSEWRPSLISASEPPSEAKISVAFKDNGQVTGSGGCNRFFGPYAISGNTIKIGPIASTRKGCPGITHVEMAFFAALEAAKTFEREGDTLVLFDASGVEVAEFVEADPK